MLILLLLGGLVLFLAGVRFGLWRIMRHLWWVHCKLFTERFIARDGGKRRGTRRTNCQFFSIIFAYSRQVFALSRGLSSPLALCHQRAKSPLALIVPVFRLPHDWCWRLDDYDGSFWRDAFHALMMAATLCCGFGAGPESAYRTPGGIVTTGIAFALSIVAFASTFGESGGALVSGVLCCVGCLLVLYSRRPEGEEFEGWRELMPSFAEVCANSVHASAS